MRSTLSLATLLLLAAFTGPARAGSSLGLEVGLASDRVAHEGTVEITARFVNRGPKTVLLYEPEHLGLVSFPRIRLDREGDGRVFALYDAPFQSMATPGMVGSVVRIAPGEVKTYVTKRDRVVPVVEGRSDWREPGPLPPGSYTVRVSYEKSDSRVPFNIGGFDVEHRVMDGLFTGRLEAPPVHLTVEAPTRPRIVISAPDKNRAELLVKFENPLEKEVVFSGLPRLTLSSKMYGGAVARPALLGSGDAKEGEVVELRVPARGEREVRVDLRALGFSLTRRGRTGTTGLGEIVPRGTVHWSLALVGADGEPAWASNGIYGFVPPPPSEGLEGVVVTARLSVAAAKTDAPVRVTAALENRSDAPVRVVRRWSFPKEMCIRIEDATGRRGLVGSVTRTPSSRLTELLPRGEEASRVAEGLSWDGDRFEPAPGLAASDFRALGPGEKMARAVDLSRLLATGLTPGRYRIRVAYRNLESGARLGFDADRRAGTGTVWSDPVTLEVE
jgi:hypothetical protein